MAVVFVRSNLAFLSANGVFHRDGERWDATPTPHVANLMAIGRLVMDLNMETEIKYLVHFCC